MTMLYSMYNNSNNIYWGTFIVMEEPRLLQRL